MNCSMYSASCVSLPACSSASSCTVRRLFGSCASASAPQRWLWGRITLSLSLLSPDPPLFQVCQAHSVNGSHLTRSSALLNGLPSMLPGVNASLRWVIFAVELVSNLSLPSFVWLLFGNSCYHGFLLFFFFGQLWLLRAKQEQMVFCYAWMER